MIKCYNLIKRNFYIKVFEGVAFRIVVTLKESPFVTKKTLHEKGISLGIVKIIIIDTWNQIQELLSWRKDT